MLHLPKAAAIKDAALAAVIVQAVEIPVLTRGLLDLTSGIIHQDRARAKAKVKARAKTLALPKAVEY